MSKNTSRYYNQNNINKQSDNNNNTNNNTNITNNKNNRNRLQYSSNPQSNQKNHKKVRNNNNNNNDNVNNKDIKSLSINKQQQKQIEEQKVNKNLKTNKQSNCVFRQLSQLIDQQYKQYLYGNKLKILSIRSSSSSLQQQQLQVPKKKEQLIQIQKINKRKIKSNIFNIIQAAYQQHNQIDDSNNDDNNYSQVIDQQYYTVQQQQQASPDNYKKQHNYNKSKQQQQTKDKKNKSLINKSIRNIKNSSKKLSSNPKILKNRQYYQNSNINNNINKNKNKRNNSIINPQNSNHKSLQQYPQYLQYNTNTNISYQDPKQVFKTRNILNKTPVFKDHCYNHNHNDNQIREKNRSSEIVSNHNNHSNCDNNHYQSKYNTNGKQSKIKNRKVKTQQDSHHVYPYNSYLPQIQPKIQYSSAKNDSILFDKIQTISQVRGSTYNTYKGVTVPIIQTNKRQYFDINEHQLINVKMNPNFMEKLLKNSRNQRSRFDYLKRGQYKEF